MKESLIATIIILFCAVMAFGAQIVVDGQPAAEIILDKDAEASVQVAAEQIQRYVEKMSGAKLDTA